MKTGCVLVLYKPNQTLFKKVLDAVVGQVEQVFVADNSPLPLEFAFPAGVEYRHMGGNVGIAAAQNQGLNHFIERGFDFIFFLDQDSIVERDMVARLHGAYARLSDAGINVGAVGPRAINRKSDKEYGGSLSSMRPGKKFIDGIAETTELICSASLISAGTFREVGLMEAGLFIDHVDYEWCWRAHGRTGCRFFICEQTTLSHQLGEGDRRVLFHNVAIPTPFRTYYQYRNYMWLLWRRYVPLRWKVINATKYLFKLFYYPICVSPRGKYLGSMLRGMRDGIFTKSKS